MDIQRAGSQPSVQGPADWFTGTVRIDPGASADQATSHLAVLESLDGESTHWMEPVTDEEYEAGDD